VSRPDSVVCLPSNQSQEYLKLLQEHNRSTFDRWLSATSSTLSHLMPDPSKELMALDVARSGELQVHFSERLVRLMREVRQLSEFGYAVPNDIVQAVQLGGERSHLCTYVSFASCLTSKYSLRSYTPLTHPPPYRWHCTEKFYRHALKLKQVANFYNTMAEQILPCQLGMLELEARAFESVVRSQAVRLCRCVRLSVWFGCRCVLLRGVAWRGVAWRGMGWDGMGWDGSVVRPDFLLPSGWHGTAQPTFSSHPDSIDPFVTRLSSAAEALTTRNRKLRALHVTVHSMLSGLVDVSLYKERERWLEMVAAVNAVFNKQAAYVICHVLVWCCVLCVVCCCVVVFVVVGKRRDEKQKGVRE
jgi:hypothetical protein